MKKPGIKTKNLFADIYQGKRVLVTGDTGFKGSAPTLSQQELGAYVTGSR